MTEKTRDMILGLVFFGSIAVLAYFTIVLTDFSLKPKQSYVVHFTKAQGLKKGDPVLILGTRSGRVTDVSYNDRTPENLRVAITLQLDQPVTLRQGFQIKIEESSFLGGRIATIDPGPPTGTQIGEGTVLIGSIDEGPLTALGKVVSDNKEDFQKIISGLRKIVDRAESGEGSIGKLLKSEDAYNSLKATLDNAKEITDNLKAGKGTMGRLLSDETLANNISTTVTNLGDVAKGLKDGKGTLGKLLNDETLYNNANEIVADLRAGKGTIGKLIYDEETANNVTSAAKNIREITDRINTGDGSLAKLLNDKSLYDNANTTLSDLKEIVADVKEGKGTLGKILRDDELYKDIQTTFKSLNRTIEDGREAAPIGTFTSILFSSF